jgi:hypothetical protein
MPHFPLTHQEHQGYLMLSREDLSGLEICWQRSIEYVKNFKKQKFLENVFCRW